MPFGFAVVEKERRDVQPKKDEDLLKILYPIRNDKYGEISA
jgi:hypothetical protein